MTTPPADTTLRHWPQDPSSATSSVPHSNLGGWVRGAPGVPPFSLLKQTSRLGSALPEALQAEAEE